MQPKKTEKDKLRIQLRFIRLLPPMPTPIFTTRSTPSATQTQKWGVYIYKHKRARGCFFRCANIYPCTQIKQR